MNLGSQPEDTTPITPIQMPTRTMRNRRPVLAVGGAVVIAALIAGMGAAIYRQTTWGDHLWASLRHAHVTATVQARDAAFAQATAVAQATRSAGDIIAQSTRDTGALVAQSTRDTGALVAHATTDAHTLASQGVRYRVALRAAHATATAQASDDANQLSALSAQLPPTATPTPDGPYLQTCLREDVNKATASCTRDVSQFSVQGFADDAIAFVAPSSFSASSIQWRVFQDDGSGSFTNVGSYVDNSVDPQNPGLSWTLSALFSNIPNAPTIPSPGRYKIEMLDQNNQFVASTVVQFVDYDKGSGSTPTPFSGGGTFSDTPTPTGSSA
jgi:hypothetical protein